MKKVPEKPTEEMLTVAMHVSNLPANKIWDIWRAMLRAAPNVNEVKESDIKRFKKLAGIED